MGLPCSKLNNSNLIKDRKIIFAVSKRYINNLKYTFTLKKISNDISFINHLRRNYEKSNIHVGVHICFQRDISVMQQ